MAKRKEAIFFESAESRNPKLLAAALRNDGSLDKLLRKYGDQDTEALARLAETLGVRPGPALEYRLALALARKFYPEPMKPGRKKKWTDLQGAVLVIEVENMCVPNDASHGVAWACARLSKREPWKSFLRGVDGQGGDPAEVLRVRYFSNKKNNKWVGVLRDSYQGYRDSDNLSGWAALVEDFVRSPEVSVFELQKDPGPSGRAIDVKKHLLD